ncbi:MAG: hypothetical protein RAK22_03125, partial [Nanoarchaeota archaeon]|nr:hypothetical protein [Nanoarchaeota archaeon]
MGVRREINRGLDQIVDYYLKNYKKMALIPIIFIIIFGSAIFYYYHVHGELMNEDISLKGGISATIYTNKTVNVDAITGNLSKEFPNTEIAVSTLYVPFSTRIDGYSVEINQNVNSTQFISDLSSIL